MSVAVVIVAAGPAAAHAQLESTRPAANDRLESAPEVAELMFSEPVSTPSGAVRLHDAGGDRLDVELERLDGGRTLRVALPDLDEGGYVMSWRVGSADGHLVSGAVTWRVGSGGADVNPGLIDELLASEDGERTVATAAAVARTLLFGGLAIVVGGIAFVAVSWPGGAAEARLRRLLWGGWGAAVLGTAAGIVLYGLDLSGEGLAEAFDLSIVADSLDADIGRWAVVRLALLGTGAWVLARRLPRIAMSRTDQLVAAGVGIGLLATVSASGHARTGRWTTVAIGLDVVHLAAGAIWVGGLAVLALVALRSAPERRGPAAAGEDRVLEDAGDDRAAPRENEILAAARRFSSVALVAVAVVVVTGTAQGIRQVESFDAMGDTAYGRLLTAKVIGVATTLALALLSRSAIRAYRNRAANPDPEAVSGPRTLARLRQSVAGEAAMAAVVIAVTALLVAADPSGSEEPRAFSVSRVVDGASWEIIVSPDRAGPLDLHILLNVPGLPLTGEQRATATLSLPARDITGLDVPLRIIGRSHFLAFGVDVPIAGDWMLEVTVHTGEPFARSAVFVVPVR